MARDMIDSLVPSMTERIVAQRLRESVKEQGGLIHKDMVSLRADIAHLRQGAACMHLTECLHVRAAYMILPTVHFHSHSICWLAASLCQGAWGPL